MLGLFQVFEILLENCKVASCFFLFLLLVRPLTDKFFSQSWHYLAFRVNLLLFFLPVRWLSEGIAPLLVKICPSSTIAEVTQQTELSPNLTITWGEQIVGESQQFAQANPIDWTGLLVSTWLVVGCCIFLWQMYCILRLHREVKGLSGVQCPVIQKLFQKCKELMGFTGEIPLLGSETIYSPVLLGLHQPKILLPVKKVQEKHLEYIFTHELTHLRRKDLWWKALLTPLTILYWWNPLIYLYSWQFETVLEYSCDEEVVKLRSHEERKCYGKAILESIDEEQTNPVLGVSFRTPEQILETRLIKMLKFNEMKTRTKVLSGVLMSAMLLGAAAPSMANAAAEAKEQATVQSGQATNSVMNSIKSLTPENEEIFTPDEWQILLERVENGELLWFDSSEEEQTYWNNYYNENPELLIPDTVELNTILVEEDKIDEYLENLTSVNASDEESFAPNVWARIMEKVESGDVFFFETRAEEQEWIQNNIVAIHEEGKREWQAVEVHEILAIAPEDESNFTPEEWADILEQVEAGEILMMEASSPMMETDAHGIELILVDKIPFDSGDDVVSSDAMLVTFSVNKEDESRYSTEVWAEFMEKVETGEMLLFETGEEEQAYCETLFAE